jgi:hypothetical protein
MIRWVLRSAIDKVEREWNYDARAPRGLRPYVRSWASRWRSVSASVLRFCARRSPTIPAAYRRMSHWCGNSRATLAHDAAADDSFVVTLPKAR